MEVLGLNIALVAGVAVLVVAIVNWIKALTNNKLGYWYMAISMGVSFAAVILITAGSEFIWYEYVKTSIVTGLVASGFFDIYAKSGTNSG